VWRQPIGAGWGSFALVNSYAITLEQQGNEEQVVCYEIATGKRVWSYAVRARYENDAWPEAGIGPRSTPAVHDGRTYTLGATGRLLCLDGGTGALIWERDLLKEFGVTADQEKIGVPFGRSNSPLIVDDLVVVPAGGAPGRRVSLVAYDRITGEKRWEGGNRQISQSSPALMTLAGRRQIVSVNEDTVSGHDVATGRVLWEQSWPGSTIGPVNVAQAQFVPPNRFFVSKSYGGGAALYEITPSDGGLFTSQEVWKSNRVMRTRFTNVSIRDGHVYGLSDGILECIDLATGERVWKDGRYGHGQLLRVDDLLVILAESGEVAIVEATPEGGGRELGRFPAIEGTSWNPPSLYGDLLLVRNAKEAAAYKLPLAAATVSSNER
jgi:outer membrane protein assembly factor BamB